MSGLFFRSLFLSLVFALLLGLCLLGLGGYILFGLGSTGLSEVQKESKGASLGLATALAHLAGERITEQRTVALSATMAETVRETKDRFDKNLSRYKIEEIFLLDSTGKPLAHSNVAKLAKDSRTNYDKPEFLEILDRTKEYPNVSYKYYPMERVRLFPEELYEGVSALSKDLGDYLRKHFPERIVTKYRLAVAVYPVDQKTAAMALHLVVVSEAANHYLAELSEYSMESLYIGVFLVFAVSFLVFFLAFLFWYAPSKRLARLPKGASSDGPTASEQELMADARQQEKALSGDGPTASERELMADARQKEEALSGDGPTATERELMADARQKEEALSGDGPTASERELMADARQKEEALFLQRPFAPSLLQEASASTVIYDAIPLDTEEFHLGERKPPDFDIYEDL